MVTSAFDGARRADRRGEDAANGDARGRREHRVNEPLPPGDRGSAPKRLKGRYELGTVLGLGSLGTTYRAEDRLLQRPVAIKILADRYTDDAAFRDRFMAATAAAGRLVHPNIVTVLDAGVVDGRPFVVMELVEGQSLRARLNERGPLPLVECQRLALQLAEALSVAHHQRVIHGDIRPENVLLDEHGRAKLTDFGFVRAAITTDVTLLGSVQRATYSPPELAIRDFSDERADVYALAVVIYEMLTGTTPRPAADRRDRRDRHAPVAPVPVRRHRPDVSPHLDRALWRALEPEPRERITTADELREALSGRGAGAPAELTPAPMPTAAWRSEPRHGRRSRPGAGSVLMTLIPLLATLGLLAVAAGSIMYFIPQMFSGLQITDVPALTGHTLTEARGIAEASGLQIKLGETIPTDDQPKGTVLSQDPTPDKRVRRGSEVKVNVSAGIRPPNVVGKPLDEARAVLVRAGWSVASVETRADAPGAAGTVVDMKPNAAEPADDRRQGITLYVASGTAAGPATNVAGVRFENGQTAGPEMTDGKTDTAAYLNKAAPTWLELDLTQPGTVTGVELVTAQDHPGVTVHEVWVWTTDGQFRGMHTFVGPTSDGQTLSVRFDAPVQNVRAVRIATTQASGRVGWREIRILQQ